MFPPMLPMLCLFSVRSDAHACLLHRCEGVYTPRNVDTHVHVSSHEQLSLHLELLVLQARIPWDVPVHVPLFVECWHCGEASSCVSAWENMAQHLVTA